MSNYPLSKQARKVIVEENLLSSILENTSDGILITAKKDFKLIYANPSAYHWFHLAENASDGFFKSLFEPEELQELLEQGSIKCIRFDRLFKITVTDNASYYLFIINDITDVAKAEDTADKVKQLNKELHAAFDQYADDSIIVTDNKGNVEFAGKEISKTCGVDNNYFIGRNVYDLEKEGHFRPSVTVKVMETGQRQVVIQNTKNARQLISLGAPIVNDDGEIVKIVSITRDYSTQIKIGSLMSELGSKALFIPEEEANPFDRIVTCNDKMFRIKALIKLVAGVNSTILINGETGTGKEMIARLLFNLSKRKNKPFVKVNCGAIAPNLVESELFGYEPGSFTGANKEGKIGLIETANHGTLFLDEISELPLEHQVKLLQVLQERSMIRVGGTSPIDLDIRIIAATNKDLEELVAEKKFREDLFYRLNVVPINIPSLRERKDDIPLLVKYFLSYFNNAYDLHKQISKEALTLMCQYPWPGNVRELENTVERLMVTTEKHIINSEELPDRIRFHDNTQDSSVTVKDIVNLNQAIEETEKKLIQMAMDKYGTTTKTAEALGVNQSTISRKIAHYRLTFSKKTEEK